MSRGGKVALITIGVVLLVLCGLCGGTYFWIDANKDRIREAATEQAEEAEAFGASTDVDGCVVEGLERADACGTVGIKCKVKANLFLDRCLAKATPIPDFCVGVPSQSEIIAHTRWALEECARRDRPDDQDCSSVIGMVSQYCARATPAR